MATVASATGIGAVRTVDSPVPPLPAACLRDQVRTVSAASTLAKRLCWDPAFDAEDGTGVRVALLDTGLGWAGPAFAGTRIRGRDFTCSGGLFDATGHGTTNAALLVGRNTNAGAGLCPGSELLLAKVLRRQPWAATVFAVAAAVRWAVLSGSDVIVLPFGAPRGAAPIARAIEAAVARGCRVIAAAGNRGPETICFPAWLPTVTAVSALCRNGTVYPNCCALPEVDMYVWGEDVPAVDAAGISGISGSSSAAVLAAGVAALELGARRRHSHGVTERWS